MLGDVQKRFEFSDAEAKKYSSYEGKMKMISIENDRLSEALIDLKNQLSAMSSNYREEQSKAQNVPLLEDKIRLLASENERLQSVLLDYKSQIDQLRQQVTEQDLKLYQIPTLENELKLLRTRCADFEGIVSRLTGERDDLNNEFNLNREEKRSAENLANQKISQQEGLIMEKDHRINAQENELSRIKQMNTDNEQKLADAQRKANTILISYNKVLRIKYENNQK